MHVPRFEVEMSDLIESLESLVFARVTKILAMVLLSEVLPAGGLLGESRVGRARACVSYRCIFM
jgi:hypothetical protein